uniref:Uncharacterized protein n=1 Tax=Oryza meridionalis TaxID=40149 RepID=A0A0E0DY91_9ORYZ
MGRRPLTSSEIRNARARVAAPASEPFLSIGSCHDSRPPIAASSASHVGNAADHATRCFAFDGKVADLEGERDRRTGSKQETRANQPVIRREMPGAFAPHLSIGRTPHQHRDVMSLATPRNSRGESGEKEKKGERKAACRARGWD